MNISDDPILRRFRTALDGAYGGRVERVLLFGSRARGVARHDADYDVAVFLKEPHAFGDDAEIVARLEAEILLDTGIVINSLPLPAAARDDGTGFAAELARDGREF